MIGVSARSYVAAGLATAIAGVAVASPVLAQSQIHLPAMSGNVELASEVSSVAQHAVSTGAVEVKQISDAVRHVVALAPHGAATATTDLAGGPLVEKAAVAAVARAVTAVAVANRNHAAGGVTVHRDAASSPAAAAAAPDLQGILGVPLLVLDIPVAIAQGFLEQPTRQVSASEVFSSGWRRDMDLGPARPGRDRKEYPGRPRPHSQRRGK